MLQVNEQCKYQWKERPVFEHELCGYISDANILLKEHSGSIVHVEEIFNDETVTQCLHCKEVYPIEDKFREFNILVSYINQESKTIFIVASEKELISLEEPFND